MSRCEKTQYAKYKKIKVLDHTLKRSASIFCDLSALVTSSLEEGDGSEGAGVTLTVGEFGAFEGSSSFGVCVASVGTVSTAVTPLSASTVSKGAALGDFGARFFFVGDFSRSSVGVEGSNSDMVYAKVTKNFSSASKERHGGREIRRPSAFSPGKSNVTGQL